MKKMRQAVELLTTFNVQSPSKETLNSAIIQPMKLAAHLLWLVAPGLMASDGIPLLTPQGAEVQSAWVPVFVLGETPGPLFPVIDADQSAGDGVMIGLAQVSRDRLWRGRTESTAIDAGWSMTDSMGIGASVTVTDFVPCRSLMHTPLAPVQSDPCTSFNASGVEVSANVQLGFVGLALGASESPAIWVLPGQLPMNDMAAALSTSFHSFNLAEPATSIFVSGEMVLSPVSSLGISLTRTELTLLDNSPDLDRMQLRLAYGDFSADMATQMIRRGMDSLSPWWAGLDLGVSWRTPWRGVLSVGAQNLITKGQPPELAQPVIQDREPDIFSRTPYVRYEQDF